VDSGQLPRLAVGKLKIAIDYHYFTLHQRVKLTVDLIDQRSTTKSQREKP